MKVLLIQRIIYVLLILASVGFYIYDIVANHTKPSENIAKVVIVVALCLIRMFRSHPRGRRGSLEFYETQFSNELRDAFISDGWERKQLIRAVRFYNEEKLEEATDILMGLKSKCNTQDDYYAVDLFLGLCFTDMQLYEEAINVYKQLLFHGLANGTIYNNLGHVYGRLGKKEEAMNYYNKVISDYPENESAYINVANLYFEEREFESAIEFANKALEINSKQGKAANLLAIIYALQEDKNNAEKYFHKAVSCGSDSKELKNAIDFYMGDRESCKPFAK